MSSICAKASVKLKQVEQENRDAMFVFLSDVWLDQVKVSQIGSREWKSCTCINDILYMYIYILDCPRVELYALSELYRITYVYLLNLFTICTFYSFQGENDFWKSCNAFIIYECFYRCQASVHHIYLDLLYIELKISQLWTIPYLSGNYLPVKFDGH